MSPLLIFTGKQIPYLKTTHGFLITVSENGWMDRSIKEQWLEFFIDYIDTSKKNILLVDGHSSNFSAEFNNRAREKNIIVMCFPPNLTHMLQPLDALYFGYLKKEIRKSFAKSDSIKTKWDILPILKSPFYHASDPAIIRSSFKKAGIYPTQFRHEAYFETQKAKFSKKFSLSQINNNHSPLSKSTAPLNAISPNKFLEMKEDIEEIKELIKQQSSKKRKESFKG